MRRAQDDKTTELQHSVTICGGWRYFAVTVDGLWRYVFGVLKHLKHFVRCDVQTLGPLGGRP